MGFLAQDASRHKCLAICARVAGFRQQFHPDQQSPAAYLFEKRDIDPFQALEKVVPHPRRITYHILFHQNLQGGAGHRTGQRITTEGAAVLAGMQHITSVFDSTAEIG